MQMPPAIPNQFSYLNSLEELETVYWCCGPFLQGEGCKVTGYTTPTKVKKIGTKQYSAETVATFVSVLDRNDIRTNEVWQVDGCQLFAREEDAKTAFANMQRNYSSLPEFYKPKRSYHPDVLGHLEWYREQLKDVPKVLHHWVVSWAVQMAGLEMRDHYTDGKCYWVQSFVLEIGKMLVSGLGHYRQTLNLESLAEEQGKLVNLEVFDEARVKAQRPELKLNDTQAWSVLQVMKRHGCKPTVDGLDAALDILFLHLEQGD